MSEQNVKTKRKNLLNLIDVFLIVLIVLIMAVFISYHFILADNAVATVELQYTVKVYNVSENLNTAKLQGDQLYDQNGVYMGTVSACSEIQRVDHSITNGSYSYLQTTAYFTVTVNCKATQLKNGSYRINGVLLSEGDLLSLASADFRVAGDCVQIAEVS